MAYYLLFKYRQQTVQLPVAPAQLKIKTRNQNRTINLIDGSEINLLKKAGLTDITFTALLPNSPGYPFARYRNGYQSAKFFLEKLEELKHLRSRNKSTFIPFHFCVLRNTPDGKTMYDTSIRVSLEDYQVLESYEQGLDVVVEISLKQFGLYGTKVIDITLSEDKGGTVTAQVEETRPDESAPMDTAHTVGNGDSLWSIARMYLNDGGRDREIYALNQTLIDAANQGKGVSKYTIYAGQVLRLPE